MFRFLNDWCWANWSPISFVSLILRLLVNAGQSCEQLVDVRADFIGKLLCLSRFAEPVRFPSLGEELVELDLCVVSGVRDTLLVLVFLFLGRCYQRLLAFLFGQSLTIELFALCPPSGQGLLIEAFLLGFPLCGLPFCLGNTLGLLLQLFMPYGASHSWD